MVWRSQKPGLEGPAAHPRDQSPVALKVQGEKRFLLFDPRCAEGFFGSLSFSCDWQVFDPQFDWSILPTKKMLIDGRYI